MGFAFDLNLGDLISSAFIAGVGLVLHRRTSGVEAEVKSIAERDLKLFEAVHTHKQTALEELFGPVAMQLQRTQIAFDRWTKKDLGLESKVIRSGNQTVRDVLLTKGHLIPGELMGDAMALVAHYDAWLLKFDALRVDAKSEEHFVFTGPDGYPFPKQAEQRFLDAFAKLRAELYEQPPKERTAQRAAAPNDKGS